MNQLRTAISVWNGLGVLPVWLGQEFRHKDDFGTALIQTPNFSCADPLHKLFPTLPKNAYNMEWSCWTSIRNGQLSSMFESTGVLLSTLVGPDLN